MYSAISSSIILGLHADFNDETASTIAENPNAEIVLTCTVCSKALKSSHQLDHHMECLHGSEPHNEGNINLPTSVLLNYH